MTFAGNRFTAQVLPCLLALACLAGASGAHANGFRVRYDFCSLPQCSDGVFPQAGVIRDTAGNLYGTTYLGGGTGCGGSGCGVVFKLTRDGIETVLHSFTGGALAVQFTDSFSQYVLRDFSVLATGANVTTGPGNCGTAIAMTFAANVPPRLHSGIVEHLHIAPLFDTNNEGYSYFEVGLDLSGTPYPVVFDTWISE